MKAKLINKTDLNFFALFTLFESHGHLVHSSATDAYTMNPMDPFGSYSSMSIDPNTRLHGTLKTINVSTGYKYYTTALRR